jgi:putative zinc finger/helix-turn-helix YgiT family protein
MPHPHARRCTVCGATQVSERRTLDYPESGLDNVQLNNVPVWICANGHEEVEVPAIGTLHSLLAELIIRKPVAMKGKEVRFLRKRVGLTAKEFSRRIGLSPEYFSQIENGHTLPERKTELLIRLFAAATLAAKAKEPFPSDLAPILEELEGFDAGAHRVRHNDEAAPNHEWEAETT